MTSYPHRGSSPHTREPERPDRLIIAARKREASRERLPGLLPAICPNCETVLGLAVAGGELLCWDCGRWVPADDLAAFSEVPI